MVLKRPILAYQKKNAVTVISTVVMERMNKDAIMVSLADWINSVVPMDKDVSNHQRNAITLTTVAIIPMNRIAVR